MCSTKLLCKEKVLFVQSVKLGLSPKGKNIVSGVQVMVFWVMMPCNDVRRMPVLQKTLLAHSSE